MTAAAAVAVGIGVVAVLFFYGVMRALLTDPEPSDSDGSTR